MKRIRKKSFFIMYIFLFLLFFAELIPILQVFLNSFRSDEEVKSMPFGVPREWVFNNWPETWRIGKYGLAYLNSLFIGAVVICTVLVFVGFGAYALSKLQFRGKNFFTAYFFVALSLPSFLYIVPDYFMLNKIGLTDSRFSLILIYTAFSLPFNMLLLRTFLGSIPRELEEAAKIDGCSEVNAFIRITVPIAKTIFLTIAILVFVSSWNEFLWANTFINNELLKPVATRYVKFVGQYSINMARIYTASAISILPIIMLYILFNRRFIEGMTSGSVKG
jgi:raffinose/stachyose/melibiose transport system permease protein